MKKLVIFTYACSIFVLALSINGCGRDDNDLKRVSVIDDSSSPYNRKQVIEASNSLFFGPPSSDGVRPMLPEKNVVLDHDVYRDAPIDIASYRKNPGKWINIDGVINPGKRFSVVDIELVNSVTYTHYMVTLQDDSGEVFILYENDIGSVSQRVFRIIPVN